MIPRYTNEAIAKLFSDEIRFATWLEVELAVMEAWADKGEVPKSALDQVRSKAAINIKRIDELEKITNHDVVAFTTSISELVGPDSRFFHLGLTSNDIVDTANNLILCRAIDTISEVIDTLIEALGLKAQEYKDTYCIGRTHGIHAEPTTFGLRIANWYAVGLRCRDRLLEARHDMSSGKLNGAVGNFANLPPEIEEAALKRLGLTPEPITTQVIPRDHHAQMMSTLAIIGGFCEMVAVNLRTLQRSEIGETQEPFGKGQKGSSAMPHKRNPVGLERISGLTRLLRTNTLAAYENMALWDERDISHSSVERVIFADSFALAYFVITELTRIIDGLVINTERMTNNLQVTQELIYSQKIMLALIDKGLTREEAYEVVQRNAAITIETGKLLSDVLLTDPKFIQHFKEKDLKDIINPKHYVHNVNYIYKRIGLLDSRNRKTKPGKSLKPSKITLNPVAPLPEINIIAAAPAPQQFTYPTPLRNKSNFVQRMDIDPQPTQAPQPTTMLQPNPQQDYRQNPQNNMRQQKKVNFMRPQQNRPKGPNRPNQPNQMNQNQMTNPNQTNQMNPNQPMNSPRPPQHQPHSNRPPQQHQPKPQLNQPSLQPMNQPMNQPNNAPVSKPKGRRPAAVKPSAPGPISSDFTAAKLSADMPQSTRFAANNSRKRQEKEQRDLIDSRFPPNIINKK